LQAALQKVEDGSAKLARSNESLQRILDSMREGLLVCDRQGALTATRSRVLVEWFGEPPAGALISDYLFDGPSSTKDRFEMAFEQLAADVLPFDVAASQLPKTWRRGQRSYGMECQPVFRSGHFTDVVFVIADITDRLAHDLQLERNKELMTIVGNLVRDRRGFQDFLDESAQLMASLRTATDAVVIRRSLHTLKGTTATYGFMIFAGHCHTLEDAMREDPREPTQASLEKLTREWQASIEGVSVFMTNEEAATVSLSVHEYNDLLFRLEPQTNPAQLAELRRTARRWLNPPMHRILGVFVQTARQVARKLRKDVELEILDHGLRLPFADMRGFFSVLVHVVRNCIDHGIESPEERERVGKPRTGHITIESRLEGAEFAVTIEDDGQGIDWNAVRKRAIACSLPAVGMDDLVDALFADGLSTRDEVSETMQRSR
jgi:two-component system chemotaxis sensor kinase CheA